MKNEKKKYESPSLESRNGGKDYAAPTFERHNPLNEVSATYYYTYYYYYYY